jgi:hypothetical protein
MGDGAYCACRSVSLRTERGIPAHPGTVTAWWWECDSCERRFLPESDEVKPIANTPSKDSARRKEPGDGE